MPLDILNFPRAVFASICNFVSEKSILELRQINKLTDEKLCTLVEIQDSVIQRIFIIGCVMRKKALLKFRICNRRHYILWKCCIIYILRNFKTSSFEKVACGDISFLLDYDHVKIFLELWKPYTSRTSIKSLSVNGYNQESVHILFEFLPRSLSNECIARSYE
ncbi:hypothetical protein PRIPAC_74207 [Pristionchus pacificus]|uniref:Uncharacterized protein n=1 Tax=Pristionchus pacificus TaxID=54126 RepID=A0A2A6D0E3_PRIPA|nr:hypothetical protein PRIPAC_74207 [Pristionchus pacificus]|eukprot:PDM83848.1 hypothetical protein PRIPAC_30335 [Pristionchus pacificus]